MLVPHSNKPFSERRFFSGLSSPQFEKPARRNVNHARPGEALTVEAREMLEKHFWDEIAFYHFCRQRLHAQVRALDLVNRP